MKYKMVIFDFDGTLADTLPWLAGMVNTVADKYGFRRIETSEYDQLRTLDAQRIIKDLGIPVWKLPMIVNHVRALMNNSIGQMALFEGIEGLLHGLAGRGVTLGLVSSNSPENIRSVLGPRNAAAFRYYECGVALFGKRSKLRKILDKSGIAPSDTIYIGDEIRDIQAAREANVAAGAVAWGYNTVEALQAQQPTALFASVDEIAAAVA